MLNQLYEKIEAVLNTLDVGGEQSRAFEGEIALLKEMLGYREPVQDDWDQANRREMLARKLKRLAVEAEGTLIPLPNNPISEWFDGTYQDASKDMEFDQVDLAVLLTFIVEVGVTGYSRIAGPSSAKSNILSRSEIMLQEQSPNFPTKLIKLNLLAENGQLWISPQGYGEKCTEVGGGSPVGMEIWHGRLRIVAFTDINKEDPQIIDLEKARESCRVTPD